MGGVECGGVDLGEGKGMGSTRYLLRKQGASGYVLYEEGEPKFYQLQLNGRFISLTDDQVDDVAEFLAKVKEFREGRQGSPRD